MRYGSRGVAYNEILALFSRVVTQYGCFSLWKKYIISF